ncbi:MAG: hypothetical protein WAX69_24920 [Victivallales bacterium]
MIPFVVHVETSRKAEVLGRLKLLGLIDDAQELAINGASTGIVAVASLSSPDEATNGYNTSLLACEQLEILAKLAGNSNTSGVTDVNYSGVASKQITVTLARSREINVVASGFVK